MSNDFNNNTENTNREHKRPYSAFTNNDMPKKHYNVRILKYQPTKVLINGRLKDKTSLSAEERQAVQTQENIDKAKATLQQVIELKRRQQNSN